MQRLKIFVVSVISIYLLVAVLLFVFQRDFLYFPTAKYAHSFKVEQFQNEGEHIDVVVLNEGQQDAIIYFGGNGESIAHSANDLNGLFLNQTLYLVNYRGYGGSSGKPTEKGIYADAQFIYDAVVKRHKQISVIGRSLGTGVATLLASSRPISKMVLVTPYDSVQQVAQGRFPVYPTSILLRDKYDSVSRVSKIKAQTLIILAEHDLVIPFKYSDRLIKAFPEQQLKVKTIAGTGHNSLSSTEQYYQLLRSFLSGSE